jgi:hypothetical protein
VQHGAAHSSQYDGRSQQSVRSLSMVPQYEAAGTQHNTARHSRAQQEMIGPAGNDVCTSHTLQ